MQKPILRRSKPIPRIPQKGKTVDFVKIEITEEQKAFLLENAESMIHTLIIGKQSYICYYKKAG